MAERLSVRLQSMAPERGQRIPAKNVVLLIVGQTEKGSLPYLMQGLGHLDKGLSIDIK